MFKEWAAVRRLLLVYLDAGGAAGIQALQPALHRLRAALPDTHISLWAREEDELEAHRLAGVNTLLCTGDNWAAGMEDLAARLGTRSFDAALILTEPGASPFTPAYACYLAGIPVRLGQSVEFGGSVLSHRISPAFPPLPAAQHHLHLLHAVGLARPPAPRPGTPAQLAKEQKHEPRCKWS
jgi:ADP-heptose:LPS heptosyltransferase